MAFPSLANACDCHFHIMDLAFPVVPNPQVPNVAAPVEDYLAFSQEIGTTRGVIVQPSLYGTNNACTLKALVAFEGMARAIVVIDERTPLDELKRWNDLGVRGIRFNLVQAGATTVEMIRPMAERIAGLGWHVQLHMKARLLPDFEGVLSSLPVDLVFDHVGRVALPDFEHDPGWPVILRLLNRGRTWVKLSGPYHDDRAGAPDYRNAVALGRRLVQIAEDRLLFGSDWPHVTEPAKAPPEDICRYLMSCTANGAQLEKILVTNPERLYGFERSLPSCPGRGTDTGVH
jgi:predicted TIM-barrel fold metal-dependent hydrolase